MKQLVTFSLFALLAISAFAVDEGKTWATATATRPSDGRVIVYRFIQEYRPTFDRSKYPIRVTVSWRYNSATGMPSVQERESMDRFEDQFMPLIETGSLASLALVRTGNDLREWTFYANSEPAFRKKLQQVVKSNAGAPIEVVAEREPRWDTYDQFVRGIRR